MKAFFNNTRKPEGLLGKCMVGSMNHAMPPSRIGALVICRNRSAKIAELGCGGGRNIRALLRKYPAATITALDYSEIAVEKAKSVNPRGTPSRPLPNFAGGCVLPPLWGWCV